MKKRTIRLAFYLGLASINSALATPQTGLDETSAKPASVSTNILSLDSMTVSQEYVTIKEQIADAEAKMKHLHKRVSEGHISMPLIKAEDMTNQAFATKNVPAIKQAKKHRKKLPAAVKHIREIQAVQRDVEVWLTCLRHAKLDDVTEETDDQVSALKQSVLNKVLKDSEFILEKVQLQGDDIRKLASRYKKKSAKSKVPSQTKLDAEKLTAFENYTAEAAVVNQNQLNE
jgi:uncharacterized phage infection (PIP) family protein YhgE